MSETDVFYKRLRGKERITASEEIGNLLSFLDFERVRNGVDAICALGEMVDLEVHDTGLVEFIGYDFDNPIKTKQGKTWTAELGNIRVEIFKKSPGSGFKSNSLRIYNWDGSASAVMEFRNRNARMVVAKTAPDTLGYMLNLGNQSVMVVDVNRDLEAVHTKVISVD